jgi:acyl-coenzyme A thioesterase PaaI-like protein
MGHLCHRFLRTGVTLEMKTQFLRAVRGPSRCEGRFTKKGSQIVFTESTLMNEEDKVGAVATATWLLLPEERG